jgi:hypothetical protein
MRCPKVGTGGDLQKIPMDPLCLLEQIVSSMPHQEIPIVRCHILRLQVIQ